MECAPVGCAPYPHLQPDGIPCQFDEPFSRVVAIGDLHGDLRAFRRILRDRGIVNSSYHWSAPRGTIVVLIGDLVDRGDDSRGVMDLAMQLEDEAPDKGGQTLVLVGNHEDLVTEQDFRYSTPADMADFSSYSRTQRAVEFRRTRNFLINLLNEGRKPDEEARPLVTSAQSGFGVAFTGNSIYAKWIRRRNAIVRIGDVVYGHGGIDDWVFNTSLEEYNSTLRAWFRKLQGVGEAPPEDTKWVIEGHRNVLWQRSQSFGELNFRDRKYQRSRGRYRTPNWRLEAMLRALGARYLVVGHTVTRSKRITPAYKGRDGEFHVYRIDTGISQAYGGHLSALEQYPGGKLIAIDEIPRCANRIVDER